VASELELSKHWEQMTNVMLQSANLPSKKEMDEVYKELHTLRKRVSKLESHTKNFKPRNKKDD
jgi:polyhydroxyalkanoate synthesis regulator phasin